MEATAPTRDESGLAARFAAGNAEAFETLFREHQREVFGWIARIVRDRALAEDATIEAQTPRSRLARSPGGAIQDRISRCGRAALPLPGIAVRFARVFSNTFWRIYRALAHFDPARDFRAWAHREPAAAPAPINDPGIATAVRRAARHLAARREIARFGASERGVSIAGPAARARPLAADAGAHGARLAFPGSTGLCLPPYCSSWRSCSPS